MRIAALLILRGELISDAEFNGNDQSWCPFRECPPYKGRFHILLLMSDLSRFAPLHRMCDAMTLLHAQPTHSPELPRSVGQ
jgi:hypothetical protein